MFLWCRREMFHTKIECLKFSCGLQLHSYDILKTLEEFLLIFILLKRCEKNESFKMTLKFVLLFIVDVALRKASIKCAKNKQQLFLSSHVKNCLKKFVRGPQFKTRHSIIIFLLFSCKISVWFKILFQAESSRKI